MRRMSWLRSLNANAEVRAMTFRPGIFVSSLIISSASPSPKYPLSLLPPEVDERKHGD